MDNSCNFKMNWVGYTAVILTIIGAVSQIVLIEQRKSSGDLSYIAVGTRAGIVLLWFAYAIKNKIPPSIFSGVIGIILIITLFIFKAKYDNGQRTIYDINVWGPQMWETMHTFSYTYPQNPTDSHKNGAKQFYESIEHVIPCSICKNHYNKYIQTNPVNVDTRDGLIMWVIGAHNSVNTINNKNTWTREMADKKYI